jgi:hypothetical protein
MVAHRHQPGQQVEGAGENGMGEATVMTKLPKMKNCV